MIRLLRRLDVWPRSLRWAVFLPAGIGAAVIVDGVLNAAFDAVGLPASSASSAGVSRLALVAFVWALTLTVAPAALSPRPWVVGLVMFVAGFIWRVVPVVSMMMYPYQRARLPSVAVAFAATIGTHVLGGVMGLYLIRDLRHRREGRAE